MSRYRRSLDLAQAGLTAVVLWGLATLYRRGYRRVSKRERQAQIMRELARGVESRDAKGLGEHIAHVVSHALHADVTVEPPDNSVAAGDSSGLDDRSRTTLRTPLQQGSRSFGVLVAVRRGRPFTAEDRGLVQAAASQAALLLEQSVLQDEVAASAVQDERARLAREIHDGLAQHLAFLKMRVAWLRRRGGSIPVDRLDDIESVIETALVEARYAITTLRSDPGGVPAVEAIRAYALEFGEIAGVRVRVHIAEGVPEIGSKARAELLRIVQEGLNNVRKHARAQHVDVRVTSANRGLEVSIQDDGVGFNPSAERSGHFGLEIMRERAESCGGVLRVTSQPGHGSSLVVWLPEAGSVVEAIEMPTLAPKPLQRG